MFRLDKTWNRERRQAARLERYFPKPIASLLRRWVANNVKFGPQYISNFILLYFKKRGRGCTYSSGPPPALPATAVCCTRGWNKTGTCGLGHDTLKSSSNKHYLVTLKLFYNINTKHREFGYLAIKARISGNAGPFFHRVWLLVEDCVHGQINVLDYRPRFALSTL